STVLSPKLTTYRRSASVNLAFHEPTIAWPADGFGRITRMVMRSRPLLAQSQRIQEILGCPAYLLVREVLRVSAIRAEAASRRILQGCQIVDRSVSRPDISEAVPRDRELRNASGAHPAGTGIRGDCTVVALNGCRLLKSLSSKVAFAQLHQRFHHV